MANSSPACLRHRAESSSESASMNEALTDNATCLELARRTVQAKVESQLRYLMRATRTDKTVRKLIQQQLDRIRETLRKLTTANSLDLLRDLEGMAAKSYFGNTDGE